MTKVILAIDFCWPKTLNKYLPSPTERPFLGIISIEHCHHHHQSLSFRLPLLEQFRISDLFSRKCLRNSSGYLAVTCVIPGSASITSPFPYLWSLFSDHYHRVEQFKWRGRELRFIRNSKQLGGVEGGWGLEEPQGMFGVSMQQIVLVVLFTNSRSLDYYLSFHLNLFVGFQKFVRQFQGIQEVFTICGYYSMIRKLKWYKELNWNELWNLQLFDLRVVSGIVHWFPVYPTRSQFILNCQKCQSDCHSDFNPTSGSYSNFIDRDAIKDNLGGISFDNSL